MRERGAHFFFCEMKYLFLYRKRKNIDLKKNSNDGFFREIDLENCQFENGSCLKLKENRNPD